MTVWSLQEACYLSPWPLALGTRGGSNLQTPHRGGGLCWKGGVGRGAISVRELGAARGKHVFPPKELCVAQRKSLDLNFMACEVPKSLVLPAGFEGVEGSRCPLKLGCVYGSE